MQLLEALTRQFQFAVGSLLRLLDEGMKDDDTSTQHEALARTTYPRATTWAQFEETVTECMRMRRAKIRSAFREQLHQVDIVGQHIDGP